MHLALTSDFPSSANEEILQRIRATAINPRVAWVPPLTSIGRQRFAVAQAQFESFGVSALEFCDIDEEPDPLQLTLERYDVVYFTGGDPLVFRRNIERSGIATGIDKCLAAGRLIVAASGGAMQFTPDLSLYRLLSEDVDSVVAHRGAHSGLGIVPYELLPHLNRLEPAFLEKVERYSGQVPCDVFALEDGAAIMHVQGNTRYIGRVVRLAGGSRTEVESA